MATFHVIPDVILAIERLNVPFTRGDLATEGLGTMDLAYVTIQTAFVAKSRVFAVWYFADVWFGVLLLNVLVESRCGWVNSFLGTPWNGAPVTENSVDVFNGDIGCWSYGCHADSIIKDRGGLKVWVEGSVRVLKYGRVVWIELI